MATRLQKEGFMQLALEQARIAADEGEVPVGAIVVSDGKIIGKGHNQVIQSRDASAHAEIMAIRDAGRKTDNYRLSQSELYVTLEPCVMCAGAILHARVSKLVFAAYDSRWGAAGSIANVLDSPLMNHCCESEGGVLESVSSDLLKRFFVEKRSKL